MASFISYGERRVNTDYKDAEQWDHNNKDLVLGEYTYNGNGQRVKKYTQNSTQCIIFHYDQNGLLIAESSSAGNIKAEYVYLNGSPLAKIEGNNVYYYHNDRVQEKKKRGQVFNLAILF